MASLIRVGENLNVMSTAAGTAMKERDAAVIREMARREAEQGVDLIDINIGPARKDGRELLPWLVNTIQEATDVRLSLDTTNLEAMEAGIAACRRPPLMNSISLQTSRFGPGLDLAARTGADCIALLWSDAGMPRDANERAMLLVDFMQKAGEAGVPMERVWIDPIVTPVSVETAQLRACLEFIAMVKEIAPGARTICGLSNVSSGVPVHLRHWLNRTYLIMLMRQGLSCRDRGRLRRGHTRHRVRQARPGGAAGAPHDGRRKNRHCRPHGRRSKIRENGPRPHGRIGVFAFMARHMIRSRRTTNRLYACILF